MVVISRLIDLPAKEIDHKAENELAKRVARQIITGVSNTASTVLPSIDIVVGECQDE